MGMKLKSGADLCGFELRNFCIQAETSAPSDAGIGRKYLHTNATDDVATGISLLNRERIYIGESTWRATAYLDDIANLQGKIDALDELLNGEDSQTYVDTWEEVKAFLEGVTENQDLMDLLNNKADKSLLANYLPLSGGTITGGTSDYTPLIIKNTNLSEVWIAFQDKVGTALIGTSNGVPSIFLGSGSNQTLIHSGNSTSYNAGGLAHSNGTVGAAVNSSGTMTSVRSIDFASNNLYDVGSNSRQARYIYAGWFGSKTGENLSFGANNSTHMLINSSGNVLIGTTTDSGEKLQVNGNVSGTYISFRRSGTELGAIGLVTTNSNIYFNATNRIEINALANIALGNSIGNVLIGTTYEINSGTKLQVKGDLYVDGNIIATKEVSAGGAGAEEGTSGSGSAEGVSEIFTPTSTSMAFDHNLGEDVIVQVYEKSGNVWNMVIVDTEITSATRVTLRFGETETTQHKVVIMGV